MSRRNASIVVAWHWVALPAVALLAGCGKPAAEAEVRQPVIAMTVPASAVDTSTWRLPGEIHARYEMPLSFRIAGQLVSREAHLGDRVKQGQVLAHLDQGAAMRNQAAAQAALDAAEHRLTFAQQQRDRDDAQVRANLISQLQWEQTHDNYAAALAGRDQAREQWALAQNQARYTTLVAERDGSITSEQAEVGQVLGAGQPVFGFAWSGERDVLVDVPEDRIASVRVGQPARVEVVSMPEKAWQARVRDIAPAADASSRTYRVKLALDGVDAGLPLGLTASVELTPPGVASGIRLPSTALFHQGDKPAVWVLGAGDTLVLRQVAVLRYGENDVLLGGGLKGGERIVVQGVHAVHEGEQVEPIAPPHPEDAPMNGPEDAP